MTLVLCQREADAIIRTLFPLLQRPGTDPELQASLYDQLLCAFERVAEASRLAASHRPAVSLSAEETWPPK